MLTLPCLACAACRVDVEDACVPSTCLHNCAACNSYFLRRLLCGRPSDWAFPGVTAVGSAHWRTSIRSSVLTACATPLLRPRPQSPRQAPQETAQCTPSPFFLSYARYSTAVAATIVDFCADRRRPLVAQPAALHLAAAPVFYPPQAIPVGRATRGQHCLPCPAQFQLLPAPPSIDRCSDRQSYVHVRSATSYTHRRAFNTYHPPRAGRPLRPTARRCIVKRRPGLLT